VSPAKLHSKAANSTIKMIFLFKLICI
jgi:hypothetical protein